MKKVTNKKINKVNKLPLNDVICCVETFNSDGVDSSLSNIKILQELGAKIETGGIRSGLTHMIWSNGNIKHLKAAEIMDIIVVSPLWIEQCQESKTKANESDFLITSDSVIISDKKSKIQEPTPNVANNLPEPDSPSLDSTKRLSSGSISTSTSKSLNTNNKNNKNNDNKKKGQKNNENKTSNEKKNIKTKKTKNNISDSDSEDDNHNNNNNKNDNNNDDNDDDMELENKKQTKKISNTTTTTISNSNSNRPSFIAISGFSGEERIFLADLVESIMSCISTSSSNNSTTTTVKKTINYGLIDDEDRSITALTSTAFVISSTIDQVRSLRVLYAMVLGIPVVTQEWLHACLENHDWVNVTPFLHPRFDRSSKLNGKVNTKRKTLDDSIGIYVGVSTSSNPSVEIVRGLVENWNLTHLVNNPNDADYIIVDNQKSKSPTIYEMRSVIAHLFQESNGFNSTISDYIINLLEKGKVLTCKTFFDCIEAGKITPHPFPTSQLPETNEKKRSISDIIDIDNVSDEEKDNIVKQTKKQPKIENNKSSTKKNSNRKQSTPKKNNKRNIIDDESEDDNEEEEEKEDDNEKEEEEEIQKNSKNKKGKNNINNVDTKKNSLNSSKSKSKLSPIKSKEKLSNNKVNKKNEEKNTNNENIDGWIDSSPNKKNGKLSTNTTTTTQNHSLLNKTNDNKNTKKRSIQSIIDDDDDEEEEENEEKEKEEESNKNKNTSIVNKRVTKKSNKKITPSTPISSSSSNLIATPTPIKNNSNNLGDDLEIDSSILGQVTEESPSW